ncbi:IS5 family transposase [Francisella sp. SYW-9]|uniref:IS5 family transposase n=1 Tax=Francisella sp. SYW-9 TaxID=2610888 RepID=UPI00123E04C9|nr:IS5 family transposase [Francisella sp. SYW-9]
MNYHIKEVFWSSILSFLKLQKGIHTNDENKLRLFIEAIFYVLRTGYQCRMLPFYYSKYRSIHKRFKDWCDKGIFSDLFQSVQDPDLQEVMLDSTIARAHACATGYDKDDNQAIGRSVGGVTHAITDALGNPMEILLSEGRIHDSKVAIDLLQNVYNTKVITDRAYHSNEIREHIQNISSEAIIPCKSINPIAFDIQIYKERHFIENFFSKLKHFRRVFSRFDKTISVYLGIIKLACTFIWLR